MHDNRVHNVEKVYQYRLSSSDSDYEAMQSLFQSKHYNWALFMGHLVIEKLIKAYHVKTTSTHAMYSHDLRLLESKSNIGIPPDMTLLLDTITGFNINTRYDSYKSDFQRRCTPEFTNEWIANINRLRLWIRERLLAQPNSM
ncbi:MAG: HEPN domain-containing protein [Bacteroidales bacterium]|jgi:HEPN domain-containing protein|nr:HEPN domain-containing protein [Bacteroidales bacterium]